MDHLVEKRIAIIPARGGSKRLPGKNIMKFFGKPMIAWTIEAALKTNLFDLVLVSTDSYDIAEVAKKYGAKVPFLRNEKADDHSTVSEATLIALNQIESFLGKTFDTVVQLMANCPLRTTDNIVNQVSFFENSFHRTSLLSGFSYGMFNPWWAHYKDHSGNIQRLYKQFDRNIRSQDLPELTCPSGATWISSRENLRSHQTFYSPGYKFFNLTWQEAVDIDNIEDLRLAKAAYLLLNEKL